MGSLFGGSSGGYSAPAPQVQRAPAPVRAAPTGPQLAPGQSVPGGPVTILPVETEDERRRRLLAAQANSTVLGDSYAGLGGGDGGNAGVGGNAGDASAAAAAGTGDGF